MRGSLFEDSIRQVMQYTFLQKIQTLFDRGEAASCFSFVFGESINGSAMISFILTPLRKSCFRVSLTKKGLPQRYTFLFLKLLHELRFIFILKYISI